MNPTETSDAQAARAFRRIPDAEATAFPWWCIIDPARIMLPHPEDVGALHRCSECGAEDGKDCVEAADDDPDCGTRVCDEPHSSRTDYRSEVTAGHMYGAITGPFFSRTAAQKHVDARRHAYSDRAQVWCLSGHESPDWRAFCAESPTLAEIARAGL